MSGGSPRRHCVCVLAPVRALLLRLRLLLLIRLLLILLLRWCLWCLLVAKAKNSLLNRLRAGNNRGRCLLRGEVANGD